jgi:phosphomannomutase
MNPEIFRAYDIRGIYGKDFTAKDVYTIAQAYARVFRPKTVALGHDVRESSPELWEQAAEGLMDAGCDVLNIGGGSTDMLYFAVANYRTDGGIIISASHNPKEYNGLKLVREMAIPISGDSGIMDVRDEALRLKRAGRQAAKKRGVTRSVALIADYCQHLRYFVDMRKLTKKRVVLNANHGYAGLVARRLLEGTPVEICGKVFFEPDGTFSDIPKGRPDPLRPENHAMTSEAVRKSRADFAVAWDADADRCFFFDEQGEFVEGGYITALLAELLVQRAGGGAIIFDPRIIWPVEAKVLAAGGRPLINKCGHSFIKERMRKEDALFGGETSAHYYFRRNFYADNGMAPFLHVLEHLCKTGTPLSAWVNPLKEEFPVSGEINFEFKDLKKTPEVVKALADAASQWGKCAMEEPIDGLSMHYMKDEKTRLWRFNLRASNTEPVLRLNVEAVRDEKLLEEKTEAVSAFLESKGGERKTAFRWERKH